MGGRSFLLMEHQVLPGLLKGLVFFFFFLPSVACLGLLDRQTTYELPQPIQCLPGM